MGYLVPVVIVKALPDRDSYLTMIVGTELLALLPRKYANRTYMVGDNTLASVFAIEGVKITLSQKSPQYIRRLSEMVFAPLIRNHEIVVKRAACMSSQNFMKVAVEGLNGDDPVKKCLPYIKGFRPYTNDTITLVRYSRDIGEYIVNALAPAPAGAVRKVIYLQSSREAEVLVDPQYLGLFLGKGGANVAMAAKLTDTVIRVSKVYE